MKASASEHGVHEVLTFGAGLGWREAQREVWGRRKSLKQKWLNRCDSAAMTVSGCSILIRHH